MNSVDGLVAQLRSLGPQDLETVHAHVTALRTLGAGPRGQAPISLTSANDENERVLYDALCKHLQKKLKMKSAPFATFRKLPNYRKFKIVSEQILALDAEWVPDQTKIQRCSMLSLYAQLVVDYMIDHGWQMYWPAILKALELLPAIVERQFPGYASNGMLPLVMDLRTKGGAHVDE